MPAGVKVGAGVGGGMASSGLFSCSAFGSSRKKPGDVPHPAPSQSAGAVPSADSPSSASGRETSYLAALCTNTPPTRGLPSWVSLARDSSSAPLAKTRNATPIPIMVVVLDLNARWMDTLLRSSFLARSCVNHASRDCIHRALTVKNSLCQHPRGPAGNGGKNRLTGIDCLYVRPQSSLASRRRTPGARCGQ